MDSASESKLSQVNPELAARVRRMAAALAARGILIQVKSGFRTLAEQTVLYKNRANNPLPVAVPGTSLHERGLAVDLIPTNGDSTAIRNAIGAAGEAEGLRWGGRFQHKDPPHFELVAALTATNNSQQWPSWSSTALFVVIVAGVVWAAASD